MDWGEDFVYSQEMEDKYFFTKTITMYEYKRLKEIEEAYTKLVERYKNEIHHG